MTSPAVHSSLGGATVLVTGGTGSFGSTVAKRLLAGGIGEVRVFSRDEKKQDDMRRACPDRRLRFYIGDVRDLDAVRDAMAGVNYVFHAAALKQVPSCEFYPMEAIRTNVMGTENVLRAAHDARVRRAIVLSTDKAAYPINAMGLSKAMAEKVMVARSRVAGESTIVCATRYGNVMASRGSVIPLFIEQLLAGGPVTVTDPGMTRFMMSLDDAVDLVLYAFEHASPGDLFVRKAPAATLQTLVEALRIVFEQDVPMRIIGTRHGEKKYETLLMREEMAHAEDLGDYYRVPADQRGLNYELYFSEGERKVTEADDYHSHNAPRLDTAQMVELLQGLSVVREAVASREGARVA
ncbi:MAG TPA: polysaccharide biosynthesis protein [Gemmatirosa sp.]|nr:polysaccharide biosynthesis protein [Gemmatirosa sp.]